MIYLDNSATTRPCREALVAMQNAMIENWGNPSSLHRLGTNASAILTESRNEIYLSLFGARAASLLPKSPNMPVRGNIGRIVFTSSGTESDNLAILGTVRTSKVKNPRVITTDSEHPAVLNTMAELEANGCEIIRLSTTNGVINEKEFESALTANTVLVSIMYVNNETGAVYDIPNLFSKAKKAVPGVVCHTDCVQAYMKIPFTPTSVSADLITVSAHKVHGPKGVGALWISDELIKKKRPTCHTFGGGQESGLRSGTENIPGIASFAAAVKANGSYKAAEAFQNKTKILREILEKNLPNGVIINKPSGNLTPHIISLTLPIPKSQPMLNYLSREEIYISSGSACSSHKDTVSHVLTAFGLSRESADRTVRVSLDSETTEEELLTFCRLLQSGIEKLK